MGGKDEQTQQSDTIDMTEDDYSSNERSNALARWDIASFVSSLPQDVAAKKLRNRDQKRKTFRRPFYSMLFRKIIGCGD